MKKTLLLLSVIVILISALAYAQEDTTPPEDSGEEIFSYLEPILEPRMGNKVPLYGNERINAYTMDGEEICHAVTSKGLFAEFGKSIEPDPTMNVYVDGLDTVQTLIGSEDPLKTFYKLKGNGDIKIEPVGATKKVKFFFTNILGKIASWF
ncbi:MAG: hypothetical protein U9R34_04580 [Nanoarchaeota archaeon]|nr:hypothetical protein [Nanoarchaeota archaeon]